MPFRRAVAVVPLLLLLLAPHAVAQQAVSYRLSFPQPEQHLMSVEVTFPDVPPGTLELRMSRTSPGRYALHEFVKNVVDVTITGGDDEPLTVSRPDPHGWSVGGHDGTVRVRYRIYGDRVDGTYLGIDSTHAHLNMPASLLWARGLEERPVRVRFERPPGSGWEVATQLLPGDDPFTYTAPNLQYLMDSPTELGPFALRTFTVPDGARTPLFRVAVHHAGSDADVDRFADDVASIVRETRGVFREFPVFDGDTYTFIADYLPWASGDGMEHRNSTILTSPTSIRSNRDDLLQTVSHEFFHAWNVERIRPASLEPFDFEAANMSGELLLAEGFTSYYGPLMMQRAGLTDVAAFAADMGGAIDAVVTSPGRQIRSAVEMSQFAPFVDAATSIDPTVFASTFLSYYTWGQAIGLGLDLTLRDRTDGRVTLDDFMRVMWERHGRPGGRVTGYVDRPYTLQDVTDVLAEVSGDADFARQFMARYVAGREVVDYAPLLDRAGLILRSRGVEGFAGTLRLQGGEAGVRIVADVPLGSPAFEAGLARDDVIVALDGRAVRRAADVERVVAGHASGSEMTMELDRRGTRLSATLRVVANPHVEVVTAERAGRTPSDAQRRFRAAWLGTTTGSAVR
jgi:predicted metalloprotease with PDZ domain